MKRLGLPLSQGESARATATRYATSPIASQMTTKPLSMPSPTPSSPQACVSPRPYACSFPGCLRRFKRRYTLKDHVKSHTGEKPFLCPVRSCRKRFTTSGNLARHKRLHPWLDTPLECLVDGCRCSFASESKLERHMRTHFGESGAHRCLVADCGKVFSTGGNLRRHMRQNHNDAVDADDADDGNNVDLDAAGDESDSSYSSATSSPIHTPRNTPIYASPQALHQEPRDQRQAPVVAAGANAGCSARHFVPMTPACGMHTATWDSELLDALACLFDENGSDQNWAT